MSACTGSGYESTGRSGTGTNPYCGSTSYPDCVKVKTQCAIGVSTGVTPFTCK